MQEIFVVIYSLSELQMGDILLFHDVDFKRDFSLSEIIFLQATIERYMSLGINDILYINLKKFVLGLRGADEAGHLYFYLSQEGER